MNELYYVTGRLYRMLPKSKIRGIRSKYFIAASDRLLYK